MDAFSQEGRASPSTVPAQWLSSHEKIKRRAASRHHSLATWLHGVPFHAHHIAGIPVVEPSCGSRFYPTLLEAERFHGRQDWLSGSPADSLPQPGRHAIPSSVMPLPVAPGAGLAGLALTLL